MLAKLSTTWICCSRSSSRSGPFQMILHAQLLARLVGAGVHRLPELVRRALGTTATAFNCRRGQLTDVAAATREQSAQRDRARAHGTNRCPPSQASAFQIGPSGKVCAAIDSALMAIALPGASGMR